MGTVASESTNSFVISAFQVGVKLLPFVTIEKAAETGLSGISVRMSDDHQARSSLILAGSCDKQPTKLNLKLGAEAGSGPAAGSGKRSKEKVAEAASGRLCRTFYVHVR